MIISAVSQLLKLNPNFKPAFDGLKIANDLVLKLKTHVVINEAFLFGSASEGKNTIDSDIDLLIIVNDQDSITKAYHEVNQPFFSEIAVDWIIKTQTEFDEQKEIGGVCFIASKSGKRIL